MAMGTRPVPRQQPVRPATRHTRRGSAPTVVWLPVRPVEGRLQGLGVASALLEV